MKEMEIAEPEEGEPESASRDIPLGHELSPRTYLAKSIFINIRVNIILAVISLGLLVVVVLLALEKPPVVVMGRKGEQLATIDNIPMDIVVNFAREKLMAEHNWTPANAAVVYRAMEPFYSQKSLAQRKHLWAKNLKRIESYDISQQLILLGEALDVNQVPGKKIYSIVLKANFRQWTGSNIATNQELVYEVIVEGGAANPYNTYGLYIYSFESEPYAKFISRMEAENKADKYRSQDRESRERILDELEQETKNR
ncbi:MAG: hypothetical protein HQL31_02490 [Planctomycetes bacterium]|nr:hypothetical protein [Planctomycetota bacterium]